MTVATGIHLVGYDRVDPKDVLAPKVGQSFAVRVLVIGSYTHAESVIGDKGGYVCMGCFATVWCGFVGLFSVFAWRGPAREKRFLETGRVVPGTISSKKQTGSGRSTKLAVTYVYKAFDGVKRGGVAYVGPEAFETIQEGQQVTVIYRLDRPAKSMLYEASDYEIVNGAS